jgi:hypothetical protein
MTCLVRKHLARPIRTLGILVLSVLASAALAIHSSIAHAGGTAEQACQSGRYAAAAKYGACEQKAMGAYVSSNDVSGVDVGKFNHAVSKCRVKYTGTWARLQAKARGTGATCDQDRFDATSMPGTVIDRLTGLQWEQKTADGTAHDNNNAYTWSAGAGGFTGTADGTAFTTFLPTLNGGSCFAGQCDWRLPTLSELQTLLREPYQCATSPCIDPIFGITDGILYHYWSVTADPKYPRTRWVVYFDNGLVFGELMDSNVYVRAVRGGL